MTVPDSNSYSNYSELAQDLIRGTDYEIVISSQPASCVAIVAPHGGRIERRTSEIARAIAADNFNLYLFEGIRPAHNYEALHLTSHHFDEPECLSLIKQKTIVITIHGCNSTLKATAFLGGLDFTLKNHLAVALNNANISVQTDEHPFPGTHENNICNRGFTRKGVQLELTDELRGTPAEDDVVTAIRSVLLNLDYS